MGIFGLSNNMTNFLGGVASSVEKTIKEDQLYTDDLVKDTSGIVIKARLDSKARRQDTIGEYSKDISQLVALGYGKQESAAIISQGRKADFVKLAQTTPRDKLNTLYKVTSTYEGDTPLSITDLAEAIEGPYKQPTVDLSGVPKRKTFLSAIGLDSDIDTQIKQRVGTLTPDSTSSDVDFDKLTQLLSGEASPVAIEKLRSKTGEISNTYASNEFTNALNMVAGGKAFIDSSGRQRFSLDKNEDAQKAMLESSQFLSEFSKRVDEGEDRQKVYNDILRRILGRTAINNKSENNIKIDKENIIPEKPKDNDDKKPEIKIIKRDDSKIAVILKKQITGDLGNKFKKLDTSGKAKFRQQFIKQLVEIGGMNRQEAIDLVKKYYP
tara:strand:+ start:574 stop:1716 length:1143 start_codon:yes stop_codon:yes gene_type:complete